MADNSVTGLIVPQGDIVDDQKIFAINELARIKAITDWATAITAAVNNDINLNGTQSITAVKTFAAGATPIITSAPSSGTHAANKTYVDAQVATKAAKNPLGAWATKADNTTYTAATDGFVLAYSTSTTNGEGIYGYTPVATLRVCNSGEGGDQAGICMPVRNGDTWKVTGTATVYWIPLGT